MNIKVIRTVEELEAFVVSLFKLRAQMEGTVEAPPELARKEHIKHPPMYAVILHNDETTGPDFVVDVLMTVFKVDGPRAYNIMLDAHMHGQALVQVYTLDMAETLVAHAMAMIENAVPGSDFTSNTGLASCELKFTIETATDSE